MILLESTFGGQVLLYTFIFLFDTQNAIWVHLLIKYLSMPGELFLWICLSSMLFGFLPWIRSLLLTDNKWQWNFILNFLLGLESHILCTQHDTEEMVGKSASNSRPSVFDLRWWFFSKQKGQFWSHVLGCSCWLSFDQILNFKQKFRFIIIKCSSRRWPVICI